MEETIASKLLRISNIKSESHLVILSKGGTISDDTPFEEYPAAIRSIPQEVVEEAEILNPIVSVNDLDSSLGPIAYGDGRFVALSSAAYVTAYSDDGINWKSGTIFSSNSCLSVCYGNGRFVAVFYNTRSGAYSDDGINWIETDMGQDRVWNVVCYGNGRFVAISQSSSVAAYSDDGITWTLTSMPIAASWSSACYGNGRFVAVAQGKATVAYSDDGITWSQSNITANAPWVDVTYGDGEFLAITNLSTTAASEDGINWRSVSGITNSTWVSVAYGNEIFVGISNSKHLFLYKNSSVIDVITFLGSLNIGTRNKIVYGDGVFAITTANGDMIVVPQVWLEEKINEST